MVDDRSTPESGEDTDERAEWLKQFADTIQEKASTVPANEHDSAHTSSQQDTYARPTPESYGSLGSLQVLLERQPRIVVAGVAAGVGIGIGYVLGRISR